MTTGEEITPADSDVHLLQRIVLRDTVAMQSFYKRHASSVYHFVFRRINDADMADEVVNDTLHQAWISAAAFAGQSSPKTCKRTRTPAIFYLCQTVSWVCETLVVRAT